MLNKGIKISKYQTRQCEACMKNLKTKWDIKVELGQKRE